MHKASKKHKDSKVDTTKDKHNAVEIKKAIEDFQGEVGEEEDGARVCGMVGVSEETQIFRAEALEQFISAGIEVSKLGKLRPWLEKSCGHRLTQPQKLMCNYLRPLKIKEKTRVRAIVKGQLVGVGFDETPNDGEAIASTARGSREDMSVFLVCLKVRHLVRNFN